MNKRYTILTAAAIVFCLASSVLLGATGLAAGTGSWNLSPGSENGFGVGTDNNTAMPMVSFGGAVYAGVTNQSGAQVWRMSGGTWAPAVGSTAATPAGFGDPSNVAVMSMHEYNGRLYAGTANLYGCQVWSTADGENWDEVVGQGSAGPTASGFGNPSNLAATAMEVSGNKLYAGLTNFNYNALPPRSEGAQVWQFDGGTSTWSQVGTSNLGDAKNAGVMSLKEYNGNLYAGTISFTLGFVPFDADHWKISLTSAGCELRKKSGTTWALVEGYGFTDGRNIAVTSMAVHGGKLFIGTTNADVSVILDISTYETTPPTYATNGLHIYSYDGSALRDLVSPGFGDTRNFTALCMESMTLSTGPVLLVGTGSTQGPGRLEVYDGTTWGAAADPGFGIADNTVISSLVESGGSAYAGTANSVTGCQVYAGLPPKLAPAKPQVTSLTPTSGHYGDLIVIKGHYLGSQSNSYVTFDDHKGQSYSYYSSTTIKVKVPSNAHGKSHLRVVTPSGTSNYTHFYTKPRITAISATSGKVGKTLTIAGSCFGASRGTSYVRVGNKKATSYSSWSKNKILVKVPSGYYGTVRLTVTTSGGSSNYKNFTVKR